MGLFKNELNVKTKGNVARKTFTWNLTEKTHTKGNTKVENVMFRCPKNIAWNDNIIVREDECAIFFRDGKAMHNFDRPGRYAMTTLNVPVLGTLGEKIIGVRQLGEIYFLQKRELRGKFGTTRPLTFRDSEFGVVRLKAHGQFSYKVEDPMLFITKFVGTERYSDSQKIIEWLNAELVQYLNDGLGELKRDKNMAVVDLPAYLNELEQIVISKISEKTKQYGLKITNLANLNINFPDEVDNAIDKRGAMNTLGVNYMQYQTGKAIEGVGKGAEKGGSSAGTFAGLGAGMGAGIGIGNAMTQGMKQEPSSQTKKPTIKCPKCGFEIPEKTKFCPECGNKMTRTCPKCGTDITGNSKFCSECGAKL